MASSGKITGSHLIAQALKLEGVHNIFTLAGDHILPVLDVMSDLDFRFIDTRHEQAAVHMADAWDASPASPAYACTPHPDSPTPSQLGPRHAQREPGDIHRRLRRVQPAWARAPCRRYPKWRWRPPSPRPRGWCRTLVASPSSSPAPCALPTADGAGPSTSPSPWTSKSKK